MGFAMPVPMLTAACNWEMRGERTTGGAAFLQRDEGGRLQINVPAGPEPLSRSIGKI